MFWFTVWQDNPRKNTIDTVLIYVSTNSICHLKHFSIYDRLKTRSFLQQTLLTPIILYLLYSVSKSLRALYGWLALRCITPVKVQLDYLTCESIYNKDRSKGAAVSQKSIQDVSVVQHYAGSCTTEASIPRKWSFFPPKLNISETQSITYWIVLCMYMHFDDSFKHFISMNGALISSLSLSMETTVWTGVFIIHSVNKHLQSTYGTKGEQAPRIHRCLGEKYRKIIKEHGLYESGGSRLGFEFCCVPAVRPF